MPARSLLAVSFSRNFLRVKQELISSGLALADFVHRHPKRIAAVIAALLMGSGGGAFAVAQFGTTAPTDPLRLVTESITPADGVAAQLDQLQHFSFTLYRSEPTRAADTPESLLKRLGIADPAAASFLRRNDTAWRAVFGRGTTGRLVTAEADERQGLQQLRTHWIESDNDSQFKRLVVERGSSGDFAARIETAPLVATQRLAGGVIRNTLFAATDEAGIPDSVARQLTEVFESSVDFRRGLRKGDRFSIVYEALEADGEPVRAGRILSAEMVNRGKTQQALWFKEDGAGKGSYYGFDGQSLRKAYLIEPLPFTRITSGFGMREHPVFGGHRGHDGVDFGAPTGTPVRTVGDGVVEFAGVQRGYGNVIYVKHPNGKDTTIYGHLSRINVQVGERVAQGEKIGEVGATGIATGPHLHFEFRVNNEPVDPREMLAEQRENQPVSPTARAAFARLSSDMRLQLRAAAQTQTASAE